MNFKLPYLHNGAKWTHPQEMAHRDSNGHVTDDVISSQKVKFVIPSLLKQQLNFLIFPLAYRAHRFNLCGLSEYTKTPKVFL